MSENQAPAVDLIGGIPQKTRKSNPNLWIDQGLIDFLDEVASAKHTNRNTVAAHILARALQQWQAERAAAEQSPASTSKRTNLKPEIAKMLRQAASNSGQSQDEIINEALGAFFGSQVEGAYE
jgi:predicted transcriptional regulator